MIFTDNEIAVIIDSLARNRDALHTGGHKTPNIESALVKINSMITPSTNEFELHPVEMAKTAIEIITPLIVQVYGDTPMAYALAHKLAADVQAKTLVPYERTREDHILHACWNWFAGGDTAMVVAARIEAALVEAGYESF